MDFLHYFTQADAVALVVVFTLLAMSVASWVIILVKVVALRAARVSITKGVAIFWQNAEPQAGAIAAQAFDRGRWLAPLLSVIAADNVVDNPTRSTSQKNARYTRLLRDAKHQIQTQLEYGQIVLATVGATAPFVGLLGTVWGIYHALFTIAGAGAITIDKVAGPVGEALVMTAAGLAVALPAVLAYNLFNRHIHQMVIQIDGFAYDLREALLG